MPFFLFILHLDSRQMNFMYSGTMRPGESRPIAPVQSIYRMPTGQFAPGEQWRQVVMLASGMRPPGVSMYK